MAKDNTDQNCIVAFSKISAAISHEIQNTLAIINENAGLLEDYCHMAQDGEGLSVEQVRSVTTTIARQVERSNTIMKNLSRFAHSADNRLAHSNLAETLSLVLVLIDRQATMKNITMSLECPPEIGISTDIISMESLVYLTLLNLFESCQEGTTLRIGVIEEEKELTIAFIPEQLEGSAPVGLPDDDQALLAEKLHAHWRSHDNQLFLIFPAELR